MYKSTDRQLTLTSRGSHLGREARRRLERTWARTFERDVLPVLLRMEGEFSVLYSNRTGRPNFPVAVLLGICILQEWQGLSDQAAADALAFDGRWQLALGVDPANAYISRRSIVGFRRRLVAHDPEMALIKKVFVAVSETALRALHNEVAVQRLDSTIVSSNIRTRGRVDLFKKTLIYFIRWLERAHPAAMGLLSRALVDWYASVKKTGDWDPEVDTAGRRRLLQELAVWVHEVVEAFRNDEAVRGSEPYQLLARLFSEHCELVDAPEAEDAAEAEGDEGIADLPAEVGAAKVHVLKKPENPGSSLQSPYDPDAGYSPKGVGYHVQIAETAGNKDPEAAIQKPEIITDYDVHSAAERDFDKLVPAIERLQAAGLGPQVMVVDGQYVTGTSLIAAEAHSVDVLGPSPQGRLPADHIGRDRFEYGENGLVVACPMGHPPKGHVTRTSDTDRPRKLHAKFDAATCRSCPLVGRCAARPPNGGKGAYHLDIELDLRARDANLTRMTTPEWKHAYRIRAGIEATNSETKRAHGLGRLKVRGRSRVRLAVSLKLTACNVKRWTRYTMAMAA